MLRKTIIARVLAATIGATMFTGMLFTGTFATATQVEAADSYLTQTLRSAFDANFYANKYPDVKQAVGTDANALFNHFINYGMKEGRMINANFDPKAYCDAYPDIKAMCNGDYSKAYQHYITYGINEGRNLTTYDAINKKKQADAAAAAAAEAERIRNTTKQINIGHGLVVTLNGDQYQNCTIIIMKDDNGYGAYIDDDLYATSGKYDGNNVYHYSTIYVNNGNLSEEIFTKPSRITYYDDDDFEDGLALALILAALAQGGY